ncbi:hypothetical protein M8994_16445 [Brucella sp. 21LCYQ03]|nr:hypothetical protein [Brucella sp. 21LCYQ03]
MAMSENQIKSQGKSFDARDRLILALYAQLRAERETREAMEWTIRNGCLSPEVLEAMASDPIPVVTSEDIQMVDQSVRKLRCRSMK